MTLFAESFRRYVMTGQLLTHCCRVNAVSDVSSASVGAWNAFFVCIDRLSMGLRVLKVEGPQGASI
jgi:hypothetical protein